MKHLKHKIGCTIALLLVAVLCNAQLALPYNIRNTQIIQFYQLSPQQVNEYNSILNKITNRWNLIKDTKYSVQGRKNEERKLQNVFCKMVSTILSSEQYSKWKKNHGGSLTQRIYTEDLGMTKEQYAEFQNISNIYSKKEDDIARKNYIEAERAEHRQSALKWYSSSLKKMFSRELADYLVYENLVINTALTLSKRYTIISENKAIKCAILKIRYNEERKLIEKQGLTKKQLRKQRIDLKDSYENAIHKVLTNEEYIACTKVRERLNNAKLKSTYNMSDEQFAKYKELKKTLAVKQLTIRQCKTDRATRLSKLRTAEDDFNAELRKILNPQQYERWKRNEQMKQAKNKNN